MFACKQLFKWYFNFSFRGKIMKLKFKKFISLAHVPAKSTPGSACYDVYSRHVQLGTGVTKTVELSLGFKFSKKYVCRIYPRSGLSLKPLFLGGGVVDSEYRGNISVILTNFSQWNVEIKKEDRIAQIIFLKKEEQLKIYLSSVFCILPSEGFLRLPSISLVLLLRKKTGSQSTFFK